jgi:hypothetical protein
VRLTYPDDGKPLTTTRYCERRAVGLLLRSRFDPRSLFERPLPLYDEPGPPPLGNSTLSLYLEGGREKLSICRQTNAIDLPVIIEVITCFDCVSSVPWVVKLDKSERRALKRSKSLFLNPKTFGLGESLLFFYAHLYGFLNRRMPLFQSGKTSPRHLWSVYRVVSYQRRSCNRCSLSSSSGIIYFCL